MLLSMALFAAFSAAVCSLTGLSVSPLSLGAGLLCIAALRLLPEGKKRMTGCAAVVVLGVVTSAALYPLVGPGMRLLCMRLFTASEAVNRYRYVVLEVPADAALAARCELWARLCGAVMLSGLCALGVLEGKRWIVLLLAMLLAAAEIVFGVTPNAVAQILLYAVLAACLVHGAEAPVISRITAAACVLLTAVLVLWFAPGVHQPLEDVSELLRDRLDAQQPSDALTAAAVSPDANVTRRENRLHAEAAGDENDGTRGDRLYRHETRYQDEISAPHVFSLQKLLLGVLLIVLLLVGPFFPFWLLDRRGKHRRNLAAAFDAGDAALAVRAMFAEAARCLDASGLTQGCESYDRLGKAVSALDPALAERYDAMLNVWYRAAYSEHPVTDEEREQAAALLRDTEQCVLQAAGFRQRIKLRYIDMIGSEVRA